MQTPPLNLNNTTATTHPSNTLAEGGPLCLLMVHSGMCRVFPIWEHESHGKIPSGGGAGPASFLWGSH